MLKEAPLPPGVRSPSPSLIRGPGLIRRRDAAQVDLLAEALMPPGVRSLRAMMHATAVEVLLYLTPLHCQDMLASLVAACNAQHAKFMLRHPDFQARGARAPLC